MSCLKITQKIPDAHSSASQKVWFKANRFLRATSAFGLLAAVFFAVFMAVCYGAQQYNFRHLSFSQSPAGVMGYLSISSFAVSILSFSSLALYRCVYGKGQNSLTKLDVIL